jgi:hypothetical protein
MARMEGSYQKFLLALKTLIPPFPLATLRTQADYKYTDDLPLYRLLTAVMAPNTDIATRALVVALKSPVGGRSTAEIHAITGLAPRTIDSIYARAISRGFEPNELPLVLRNIHVEDAPRSGRPSKHTDEAVESANEAEQVD